MVPPDTLIDIYGGICDHKFYFENLIILSRLQLEKKQ